MPAKIDPDSDQIPRQSWLALLPRRSLWKALAMLLMLLVIVLLQRRTDLLVRHLGGLAPSTSVPQNEMSKNR